MVLSRRELFVAGAAGCVAGILPLASQAAPVNEEPFYALNTGTLMGFNLPIEEEIKVAAQAGYRGTEVWMFKILQFREKGGSLAELKKHFTDSGVRLMSAISFPQWLVDDDDARAKGMEQMKEEMEILAQLDCPYVAAPAAGVNRRIDDLDVCGARYRKILQLGDSIGVIPLLELWGTNAMLSKLSDCVTIAIASKHPKASLLLDAYHYYRGGNQFESLKQIAGSSMHVFHVNDYPADPPREKLTDADRIYPGDGICPLAEILKTLRQSGFRGVLSLELFNKSYWESSDPLSVAKTGLEKMRNAFSSTPY